jgi:diguanylate cyclase (GGDEF)-like protein
MLRVLMVGDDDVAAELTLRTLESAGLPCTCEHAHSEGELRAALGRGADLILADGSGHGLDAMTALSMAKDTQPTTPFIIVSGDFSEAVVQRARAGGATDYIAKTDLQRLPGIVRAAIPAKTQTLKRAPDPLHRNGASADIGNSAEHLLQRQAALELALKEKDGSALSNLLSQTPPAPAALVMIESTAVRERYRKVLHTVDIDVDLAADMSDALSRLASRTHALLLTDRPDLIRQARDLRAGTATHMILINGVSEASTAAGLRAGANEVMPQEPGGEQFWAQMSIARRIVSFAAALQSAITDNRLLSSVDELTRVGNRSYFEHQWSREVKRALRYARPLSLVLCDIDHFKSINDQHGHLTGDSVLTEFGERLTQGLRLGEDWVARIGGEEFAIVLPETGRFEAIAIAERLRQHVAASVFLGSSLALAITASFGCCSLAARAAPLPVIPQEMLRVADEALYKSKRSGRNCVTEGLLETAARRES